MKARTPGYQTDNSLSIGLLAAMLWLDFPIMHPDRPLEQTLYSLETLV